MRTAIRKLLYRSDIAGAVLDPVVAEVLAAPARYEDELVGAVAKRGGDADVQKAAAAFARATEALTDAFDGKLPASVRKAMRDVYGDDEPDEDEEPADWNTIDAREAIERDKKKKKPKPGPSPIAKTEPKRSADEILADVKQLAKRSRWHDEMFAEQRLEKAVERVRKSEPLLTKEQAFTKALHANPDIYGDRLRHQLRKSGYTIADPDDDPPALDPKLERAAADLRKADPSLTEPQSVAKALYADPTLYS